MGIFTCSLSLIVTEISYAFELKKDGRRIGRPGAQDNLGAWVLVLNVVALVLSLAIPGIGLVLGFILGFLATWLVQAEINVYGEGGHA